MLVLPSTVFCAGAEGTAGAVFLKIPAGSRPAGMGSAFTGISDDVNGLYWNPAGISQLESIQVMATYSQVYEDINNTYVGIVLPFGNQALGVAITYLSMGDIEMRNDTGILLTESSKIYDMAIAFSYSKKMGESAHIGFTGKNLISKYGPYSGTGLAMDFGFLYRISDPLAFGINIQNFGGKMKIDTVTSELPMTIKLGFGYKLGENLLLGFDIDSPKDGDMKIHFGGEYKLSKTFIARAGYDQLESKMNFEKGITAGFSIVPAFKTGGTEDTVSMSSESGDKSSPDIRIDYSLTTLAAELGMTNRVSLVLKF
jgi:hypothetical protein